MSPFFVSEPGEVQPLLALWAITLTRPYLRLHFSRLSKTAFQGRPDAVFVRLLLLGCPANKRNSHAWREALYLRYAS